MMLGADDGIVTFERFFRDEYPRLVPMLQALTGDRGRAEDLAQDALAAAQRRLGPASAGTTRPVPGCDGWPSTPASNARRRQRREAASLRRVGAAEHDDRDRRRRRAAVGARAGPARAAALGGRPALRRGPLGRRGGRRAAVLRGHGQDAPVAGSGHAGEAAGGPVMNDHESLDLQQRRASAGATACAAGALPRRRGRAREQRPLRHPRRRDRGRRGGGSPRRWWIAPAVLATAAAAVLAVVLVTPRTDETVRQVPADTVAPARRRRRRCRSTPAPAADDDVDDRRRAIDADDRADDDLDHRPDHDAAAGAPGVRGRHPARRVGGDRRLPGTFGDLAPSCRPDGHDRRRRLPGRLRRGGHGRAVTDGSSYELTWNGSSGPSSATARRARDGRPVCAAFGDPPELYYMSGRSLRPGW